MRLDSKTQAFVKEWIDYLLNVIDGGKVEYDIVDEYEQPPEKAPIPINHYVDYDKEMLYVISLTDRAFREHA